MAHVESAHGSVGSSYGFDSGKGLFSQIAHNVQYGRPVIDMTGRDGNYGGNSSIIDTISGFVDNVKDKASDILDDSSNYDSTGAFSLYDPGWNSGASPFIVSGTPQPLEYVDAPYASMYGMDIATAYQEALTNTAHQRQVADLKAAGLNPVLGISGSGAANFYGTALPEVNVSSFGGVGYGSAGSGKSTLNLSESAKKLQYWVPTLVNGVTQGIVRAKGGDGMTAFGAGMMMQNITDGLLGAVRNHA